MSVYSKVGGLRPGRSVFNLSHEKKFDCDMGELVPILAKEMVPGDTFKVGNEIVIRFQPLVAPVLQEINAYVHYFFVPNRLMMEEHEWEEFISGGLTGETSVTLPRWTVANGNNAKYTLWDYFGLPTGVTPHRLPLAFPKIAYNMIYNEYYRSEDLQDEVDTMQDTILHRDWKRDYFTSALPYPQRGTAPALPMSGMIPLSVIDSGKGYAYFDASQISMLSTTGYPNSDYASDAQLKWQINGASNYVVRGGEDDSGNDIYHHPFRGYNRLNGSTAVNVGNVDSGRYGVDISNAATFDVSDLRLAFQIQKWMERNMRAGVRYTEFLRAHFGISPHDDTLQRPQYIGGSKSPVMISEVLQTSQTTSGSAQGNLAGHGLTADKNYISKYTAREFGWIIGIMSVMPKATYQQGVDASLLRETRYDYYFPEFAHLSEQAVLNEELYADGSEEDEAIFGYQGRYNELRSAHSLVCGGMRDTFDYWHVSRQFAERPELNSTFLECNPRKDIFAVPEERGLIVNFANIIKAIRPLPAFAEPGLIDHN